VTSAPAAAPPATGSTSALWGILAVFLVLGAVALATFVYGIEALATSWPTGLVAMGAGAFGAFLAFLFTAGILYRVDRYRGANRRKVMLFE
jgi:uncharacterized integral membrane protein